MSKPLMVTTTFANQADALRLARLLLERKLIACAQLSGSTQSLYWWQNEIVDATEIVMTMKTTKCLFAELAQVIQEHHPYDVPEIVGTEIVAISQSYRNWLESEVK